MDLTWRPMTLSDAAALTALRADVEKVDQTGEHDTEADVAEDLRSELLDLEAGSVAVLDRGELVGYGVVWTQPRPIDVHRVHIEAAVRPAYRRHGIGRELLRRLVPAAVELHGRRHPELGLVVHATTHEHCLAAVAAVLGPAGFGEERWFFTMRRDLTEPVPEPRIPPGLRLAGYRRDIEQAVRQAFNEAFADHWGSPEQTERSWQEGFGRSRAFRPDESYVLLDERTGEVAAFVLNRFYDGEELATGIRELWIGDIGTRRAWRGRGAASALLAHTLAQACRAGYQRCGLGVDADNPTGALGIYQRAGFAVTDRWTTYALPMASQLATAPTQNSLPSGS